MKFARIIILFILLAHSCFGSDTKLIALEKALSEAETQLDMNIRSKAVVDHWEKKLNKLEVKVQKDLDATAGALFEKAKTKWIEYRSAQIKFEGDLYRGGSIQPLIHNSTFIRITKERYNSLNELHPEGSYE
jgi:uncharacterized protein YecT (DUF1311 family)